MKLLSLTGILMFSWACFSQNTTFTNPLLPMGPDPWMMSKDGVYYYMNTLQDRLEIRKTENPVSLKNAERKVVWKAPENGPNSHAIWAPEIHYLDGKWYIYFAADDGENKNHRMWVLECDSQNPLSGNWTVKGKLSDPGDHWMIDASILEYKNKRYLVWSGWEGYENTKQHIFISEMLNPWTLAEFRVKLSSPEAAWELNGLTPEQAAEKKGVFVNEGPQPLKHGKDLFIIFSANGCWTDHYALGYLKLKKDGDVLKKEDWVKSEKPILVTSRDNDVYAPGHNSFFKSPDGTEDWILYHANPNAGDGCGYKRSPRAQIVNWDSNGNPLIGTPLPVFQPIIVPSGVTSSN